MSYQNTPQQLTQTSAWCDLTQHAEHMQEHSLKDLFEQDNQRAERFSLVAQGMYLDYAKNHLTDDSLQKLLALAEQQQLSEKIAALFHNQYASDHVALRDPASHEYEYTLSSLKKLLHRIRERNQSDHHITDIVHLGVGGSYLGPLMVNFTFQQPDGSSGFWCDGQPNLHLHFAYAMDGQDLFRILAKLQPQTTLFVVASKSFTSIDTLANAELALAWLQSHLHQDRKSIIAAHFIGISASPERMRAWGIAEAYQLIMSEKTIGRYSLWSVMGLPIALCLGLDRFKRLLAGAHALDKHFIEADFLSNIAVMSGLIAVWNHAFLRYVNHIYLPYSSHLHYLPEYLQQLSMESLGKSYTLDKLPTNYVTGAVTFGAVGFAAQHSFFQLLHQGTSRCVCDFIGIARPSDSLVSASSTAPQLKEGLLRQQLLKQHRLILANCFAQSRILMLGSQADQQQAAESQEPGASTYLAGNKPSVTILLDELTPFSLGSLLALYEHKTFVESVMYHINPFSQDGVELGKKVAHHLYNKGRIGNLDSSSAALLKRSGFDIAL